MIGIKTKTTWKQRVEKAVQEGKPACLRMMGAVVRQRARR